MTTQIPDSFSYQNRPFRRSGWRQDHQPILIMSDLGITPVSYGTSCWKGFLCAYDIRDDGIYAKTLRLWVEGEPPPLGGVHATPRSDRPLVGRGNAVFEYQYDGLSLKTTFTGKILLSEVKWNILMKRFRQVFEFTFENGALVRTFDCAAELVRIGWTPTPRGAPRIHRPNCPAWIAGFSEQYTCDLLAEVDPGHP